MRRYTQEGWDAGEETEAWQDTAWNSLSGTQWEIAEELGWDEVTTHILNRGPTRPRIHHPAAHTAQGVHAGGGSAS